MSKGPYRTAAPDPGPVAIGFDELGGDPSWVNVPRVRKPAVYNSFSGTALVEQTRSTTFSTPKTNALVAQMLRQRGTRVDWVRTNTDIHGMIQVIAYRQIGGSGWKHWKHEFPEERLLSNARDREKLYAEFLYMVDCLHRIILRTDREGFPGTYTDRDLEATLV